jgi:hypothetical protein
MQQGIRGRTALDIPDGTSVPKDVVIITRRVMADKRKKQSTPAKKQKCLWVKDVSMP